MGAEGDGRRRVPEGLRNDTGVCIWGYVYGGMYMFAGVVLLQAAGRVPQSFVAGAVAPQARPGMAPQATPGGRGASPSSRPPPGNDHMPLPGSLARWMMSTCEWTPRASHRKHQKWALLLSGQAGGMR